MQCTGVSLPASAESRTSGDLGGGMGPRVTRARSHEHKTCAEQFSCSVCRHVLIARQSSPVSEAIMGVNVRRRGRRFP